MTQSSNRPSVHPFTRGSFLTAVPIALAAGSMAPALAQNIPLRVGATANDTYAEAYYAKDMGFFTKAGLDVTITTLQNGSAVAAGVASGALDCGVSNPVQLGNAVIHGIPFAYFAGGALYSSEAPTTVLCIAKDSPIANVKQLEGKTVAVNALKDLSALGVDAYMTQNGADLEKVQFIELPFSEMGAAIARGSIAAGLISEPSLTAAKQSGGVRPFANVFDAIAKRFYISGWFATRAWLAGHRDVAGRYAKAMYETARWANAHQEESAVILARYSKISGETARQMVRATYAETLNPAWLQPPLDLAGRAGLTSRRVAADEMMVKT